MVSGASSQSTARLAIDHRIKLKATPSRAGPELILGSISAIVERLRPQTVTRIQRSIILYLFRRPSGFPSSRPYFDDTARNMPGFMCLYSSQHGVHSDTNFSTFYHKPCVLELYPCFRIVSSYPARREVVELCRHHAKHCNAAEHLREDFFVPIREGPSDMISYRSCGIDHLPQPGLRFVSTIDLTYVISGVLDSTTLSTLKTNVLLRMERFTKHPMCRKTVYHSQG